METKGDSGRSPEAAPATTIESTPSTIATSGSPALDHIEKRRQKKRMLKECLTRPAIVPLLRLEDDDDLGVKWMLALVPRN
uniref:Uncharacterized protein n=1 Tax=Plectus sambesii TaxID=2011161 RepID=A0A914V0P1_9BILA